MNKPKCPNCGTSDYVVLVKTITKYTTIGGGAAGAAAGAYVANKATEGTDNVVVKFGAIITGTIVGSILGGAITGTKLGKELGEKIDESIGLYRCNKCGLEFKA
jgi:phage tail tape-measure protein